MFEGHVLLPRFAEPANINVSRSRSVASTVLTDAAGASAAATMATVPAIDAGPEGADPIGVAAEIAAAAVGNGVRAWPVGATVYDPNRQRVVPPGFMMIRS
jgi:hypothetical protein